ncbi:primase alpha helix C-terminal domain-containing protein [Arcanobacterium hippocoleae]|uniref:Primase C-terminal 1 domain-containing protein n=1 Tax=Arcanobacterium hippocoleae TaxID=149017 RepID=A0ABU1T1G1_9ACTO|nr:primase alpha helix C-terminal domain-containing protein [Arcanobacterium hippocoleae]MDR6938686.1 hypothetical protein [Arcanobacterium hippocoleae]
MKPMTMYTSTVAGQHNNAVYPNRHEVSTAADLEAVARLDHVVADYQDRRRSSANFLSSNTLVMDVDNDHSEEPADWVTPETLAGLIPGVAFMTATSRNHMKTKGAQSARPRFHVYFPITPVTDANKYAGLKKQLATKYGFFDANAVDAGRFIYGHPAPETTVQDGDKLVDEWLVEAVDADMFAAFDTATQAIAPGSRNATLSRFAGRVLVRYGDSPQARELFDRKAGLCEPPLPSVEVENIWASVLRFATKVATSPGYVPPEVYAALTGLKPEDFTDVGQADTLAGEYASKIRYSLATRWLVFEGGFWVENDLSAQGVAQELTARQLDEANAHVAQAWERMQTTGADLVIASASSCP